MKSGKDALRDGLVSGALASLASTAALGACGQRENQAPYAPINAISHWVWGDLAAHQNDASARHTLLGYAIHHASSTLWATVYEACFGDLAERKAVAPALLGGAAVAGLACFVDYNLTPRRLQPGFEMRLSRRSLFLVYASFGAALALRGVFKAQEPGAAGAVRRSPRKSGWLRSP